MCECLALLAPCIAPFAALVQRDILPCTVRRDLLPCTVSVQSLACQATCIHRLCLVGTFLASSVCEWSYDNPLGCQVAIIISVDYEYAKSQHFTATHCVINMVHSRMLVTLGVVLS